MVHKYIYIRHSEVVVLRKSIYLIIGMTLALSACGSAEKEEVNTTVETVVSSSEAAKPEKVAVADSDNASLLQSEASETEAIAIETEASSIEAIEGMEKENGTADVNSSDAVTITDAHSDGFTSILLDDSVENFQKIISREYSEEEVMEIGKKIANISDIDKVVMSIGEKGVGVFTETPDLENITVRPISEFLTDDEIDTYYAWQLKNMSEGKGTPEESIQYYKEATEYTLDMIEKEANLSVQEFENVKAFEIFLMPYMLSVKMANDAQQELYDELVKYSAFVTKYDMKSMTGEQVKQEIKDLMLNDSVVLIETNELRNCSADMEHDTLTEKVSGDIIQEGTPYVLFNGYDPQSDVKQRVLVNYGAVLTNALAEEVKDNTYKCIVGVDENTGKLRFNSAVAGEAEKQNYGKVTTFDGYEFRTGEIAKDSTGKVLKFENTGDFEKEAVTMGIKDTDQFSTYLVHGDGSIVGVAFIEKP